MIILKGGTFEPLFETDCCEKPFILSLTTAMPRSSEALSSKILERQISPNKSLAAARIVVVLPRKKIKLPILIHGQSSYWTAKSSFLFLASDHTETDPNYTLRVDFRTMIFL